MSTIDLARVRQLVSVPTALTLLGWPPLRTSGHGIRGPCPIHRSHSLQSRSMSVTLTAWRCHVCRAGGSVTELWQLARGLPLVQAARDLCRAAGVHTPYLPRLRRRRRTRGEAR